MARWRTTPSRGRTLETKTRFSAHDRAPRRASAERSTGWRWPAAPCSARERTREDLQRHSEVSRWITVRVDRRTDARRRRTNVLALRQDGSAALKPRRERRREYFDVGFVDG